LIERGETTMAHDIKLTSDKGSMADRINARLQSSGVGANPDVVVKKGEGPTRTITHIHHGSTQHGSRTQNSGGNNNSGNV
jgi:hypothetical protein